MGYGPMSAATKVKTFLDKINVPPPIVQALNVVGEAGEFAEAFRRYVGGARRPGSIEEVSMELADVIISAQCMAVMLGLDPDEIVDAKWDIIMSRGFGNQTKGE